MGEGVQGAPSGPAAAAALAQTRAHPPPLSTAGWGTGLRAGGPSDGQTDEAPQSPPRALDPAPTPCTPHRDPGAGWPRARGAALTWGGTPGGAGTFCSHSPLPSGARGRGSKQSQVRASGLLSQVPARPSPQTCCLFREAFLGCCQPHPALCSQSPKVRPHTGSAFPELLLASGLPGQPGPLPAASLPEGSWRSLGPSWQVPRLTPERPAAACPECRGQKGPHMQRPQQQPPLPSDTEALPGGGVTVAST